MLGAEQPDLRLGGWLPAALVRDYLVLQNPFTAAMQFAEGLLLLLLAAETCAGDPARRERTLRMMIIGACAAAFFDVLRIATAAVQQPASWKALTGLVTQARVSVQIPDWNAAGSYFAMMLIITGAFAAGRKAVYGLPFALIGAALWLTGFA